MSFHYPQPRDDRLRHLLGAGIPPRSRGPTFRVHLYVDGAGYGIDMAEKDDRLRPVTQDTTKPLSKPADCIHPTRYFEARRSSYEGLYVSRSPWSSELKSAIFMILVSQVTS